MSGMKKEKSKMIPWSRSKDRQVMQVSVIEIIPSAGI